MRVGTNELSGAYFNKEEKKPNARVPRAEAGLGR